MEYTKLNWMVQLWVQPSPPPKNYLSILDAKKTVRITACRQSSRLLNISLLSKIKINTKNLTGGAHQRWMTWRFDVKLLRRQKRVKKQKLDKKILHNYILALTFFISSAKLLKIFFTWTALSGPSLFDHLNLMLICTYDLAPT